jgi:photosystem II stability/assembly factor-like uncharacterized protein
MTGHDLNAIYREAQSALKNRDYDRASELLRQILVVDENYKDVSRLLAQTVKLKRRKWYNHPVLWSTIGLVMIVAFGFLIAPSMRGKFSIQPSVTFSVFNSPTATLPPAISPTATQTLFPTPIPIPLAWKRISMGQEFERDTVTAFATDKKDPDVIYAGMKNAGVYKTIDGGLSWRPAHYGLASTQVESLLIDSQNPRLLYAGTMGGVFKTEDGGESWFRIGDGIYLLMDTQDNSHLYARDENAIYETKDQGNTWEIVHPLKKDCPNSISSWAIHPTNGDMLFIGGGETCAGVYQSSDSGRNWTLIGLEDKTDLNPLAIGLDEQGNFSIYTIFDPPVLSFGWDEKVGIYFSYDGGVTWSHKKVGGSLGNGTCNILISDTDNPATIYCAGERLYVTQKKGEDWQAVTNTETKVHTAIYIDHPNGKDRIIAGGTNINNHDDRNVSIFISTDNGSSWTEKNNGIGSTRSELKIDPMNTDRMYLATYYYSRVWYRDKKGCTLYRSMDGSKSWSSIKTGEWCGTSFDSANAFYLIERSSLQKSLDGGENWLWKFPTIDQYSGNSTKMNRDVLIVLSAYGLPSGSQSISANPYIDNLIYAVGNTIYYTTTDMSHSNPSWQLSEGGEGSWDARLFYTDQSKIIYAIGRTHQSYTTDNGKTWQNCGEDVTTSLSDSRLALDLQGSRLYLATPGQGVLVSTDKCESWQASNEGLSNLFINTLAIDPNDANKIYAGTDGGAYLSFDGSQTWGQVNDGLLGATVVYSIAVDKESNVYAATPYGIFILEKK